MNKILIIDDDSQICQTAQLCLEAPTNWQTWVASSGVDGLVLAESQQPDAILLDLIMPEMDGVATLHNLQTNPKTQSIPVILFTSIAQTIARHHLDQLPIAGLISKPFIVSELAGQIRSILETK